MIEHCKIVLNGVKNDKQLFRKELIKSIAWLGEDEKVKLSQWVREKYIDQHADIINEILSTRYNFAS